MKQAREKCHEKNNRILCAVFCANEALPGKPTYTKKESWKDEYGLGKKNEQLNVASELSVQWIFKKFTHNSIQINLMYELFTFSDWIENKTKAPWKWSFGL